MYIILGYGSCQLIIIKQILKNTLYFLRPITDIYVSRDCAISKKKCRRRGPIIDHLNLNKIL